MEKSELISALDTLLRKIAAYDTAQAALHIAESNLQSASDKPLGSVSSFDAVHKHNFIKTRTGPEPVKPGGAMKLAVPVYLAKKKAYEKEHAQYMLNYQAAEQEYYASYKAQRSALAEENMKKRAAQIEQAEASLEQARQSEVEARYVLNADELLPETLKQRNIVESLIRYLKEMRADTLKDAINLYYGDEHRKRLEEYAKEQLRLSQEVLAAAKHAEEVAESASADASSAYERANEAYDKAVEAYEHASEAYDKAQDAYWASNN